MRSGTAGLRDDRPLDEDELSPSLLRLATTAPIVQKLYGADHMVTTLQPHWQRLRQAPPIIPASEQADLRRALATAARDNGHILHLGDCVEVLTDCRPDAYGQRLAAFSTLRSYMEQRLSAPVVTIARMVGQFAKPRSQFFEHTEQGPIPSFMGEMINGRDCDPWSRQPDLNRLHWVQDASRVAAQALDDFAQHQPRIWSSHEAYNLVYDGAQTMAVDRGEGHEGVQVFNHSCHLPWIGVRSHYRDSPYIRYVGFLDNPIGAKVGPQTTPEALEQLVQSANPRGEPGKLVLISRFGAGNAQTYLPPLLSALRRMGASHANLLWIIDPMHGNTFKNSHGLKVRSLEAMAQEIDETLAIHGREGSAVHGLHLESSPQAIFECCETDDDGDEVRPGPLYTSSCDPRLNYEQTLAIIGHYLDARRSPHITS